MFDNIYNGKRVLVTGHTGFKGSWLCAWLLSLGAEVGGLSIDIPTTPSHFAALALDKRIHDFRGDIRDRSAVKDILRRFKPDMIFHLAAQALVRLSYEEPARTFETNILGTMNVLEAMRDQPNVEACVVITSDKCYRNDEWVWGYRETDYLGGSDPYSASKGCAEILAHSYFQSFFSNGTACATTRAGNVIGGGDWAKDRIVPDCARAWSANKPVIIRNPNATRPWQHVLEPLSGYLWLGACLANPATERFNARGEAFNFGPAADVNSTVAQVVEMLSVLWPNFKFVLQGQDKTQMKECNLLKLCCDKALARLSWKATLKFAETIRMTAQWYKNFYGTNSNDMWQVTTGQIQEYASLAAERGMLWANA